MDPTPPLSSEWTWPVSEECSGKQTGSGALRRHGLAPTHGSETRDLAVTELPALSPLPSLARSRVWPSQPEDRGWKARFTEEVALAGEPAGPGQARVRRLPHRQPLGADRRPLHIWVSVRDSRLGLLAWNRSSPPPGALSSSSGKAGSRSLLYRL